MPDPTSSDGREGQSRTDDSEGPPSHRTYGPKRTPPYDLLTRVATEAQVLFAVLILVTLVPATVSGLDSPVTVFFGSLLLVLLLYQAGFLLYYRELAADRGVAVPGRYSNDVVESETGVTLVALADVGLVLFTLAALLS